MAVPQSDVRTAPPGTALVRFGNGSAPAPAPSPAPALVLSGVSTTGQVGTPGAATVSNSGPGSANWSAGLNNGASAAPSSGTLASGASVNLALNYVAAATHLLTLVNGSGGAVSGGTGGNGTSSIVVTAPAPGPAPAPAVAATTGGIASASLSSVAGASSEPVSFGLALKEGAFPAAAGITVAGLDSHQVQVRNAWPDGSAKFVLVSGRATIPAGSAIAATLLRGAASSGVALTEANLLASGVDATLQFGGGPVMTLSSLIGVAAVSDATGLTTAGRVRQLVAGPQMSAWLYACRLSSGNAHVIGWMEVRFYGGNKVQVLPWVENGFTRVAGCAGQIGTLTFALGGATRFTQAGVHVGNHCRVVAQDTAGCGHWAGVAPDLYVAPDPSYLQDTRLVPRYSADTSASTSRLNGLTQAYSPTTYGQLASSPRDVLGNGTNNGEFDAGMSNAGYHAGIGVLPEWDAFYLTSKADQRARNAVLANAMGYGRYGVHFRDEVTLRPVSPADVPNKTLPQSSNHNIADVGANQYGGAETLPTVASVDDGSGNQIKPEYWAQTHHPSAGFLAYLLTGHEFFLELSQFVAGTCFLRQNNIHRDYGQGLQKTHMETVRGQAWALRSIFQAATISVDGSSLQSAFSTIAANNISSYHTTYITGAIGSYGVPRPYSNFQPSATPPRYNVNAWELDFSIAAWGYGLAMKPPVGDTALTQMLAYFRWHAQWIVVRLGPLGNGATYGYNAAGRQNSVSIAKTSDDSAWNTNTNWFANPGEMFQYTIGSDNAANTTNTIGAADGNNGFFPDATSYWGNLQPAAAYSVDFDVVGAWEAYLRLVGASNWASFDTATATSPVWAVRSSKAPPTWAAALPVDQWYALANTNYTTWAVTNGGIPADSYWGTNPYGAIITAYCDPANDLASGRQYFFGGGHGDGRMNGVVEFDWNKLQWRLEFAPTPSAKRPPLYVSDGRVEYPSGANGNGYFLPAPPLVGGDAAYGTPLARVSTHMYAAATLNTNTGTIHYFYGLYGEYSVRDHAWSEPARALNVVGSSATIRRQLLALDATLGLATPEQTNLTTGASAIFDEVTDRFFVTLNAGDYASDYFHGFCVFNPYTRTVESVHNGGYPAAGWYWRVSTLPIRVGRKIYAFIEQAANYLQPIVMNRGVVFDMDTKAFQFFVLDGGTTAEDNTMPGFTSGTSTAETIPGCFDGTRIHRWNYNEASKRSVLLSMGITPTSGAGTVGDPFVMPQTKRTLGGSPPAVTNYVYKRLIWLENARCLALVPSDNANAVAIRLS